MMKGIRVYAPAKVNLVLRVLDRRADGYHNLWSLMQTVGLEDEVHMQLQPETAGVRLQCDDPNVPSDGSNLVAPVGGVGVEGGGISVGCDIITVRRILLV